MLMDYTVYPITKIEKASEKVENNVGSGYSVKIKQYIVVFYICDIFKLEKWQPSTAVAS